MRCDGFEPRARAASPILTLKTESYVRLSTDAEGPQFAIGTAANRFGVGRCVGLCDLFAELAFPGVGAYLSYPCRGPSDVRLAYERSGVSRYSSRES